MRSRSHAHAAAAAAAPAKAAAPMRAHGGGLHALRAQEQAAEHSAQRVADSPQHLHTMAPGARVHHDAHAAAAARALNARAFTLGDDVYFAAGQFQPQTRAGRQLLAHELAHVQQQRADGRPRVQCRGWLDDWLNPLPPGVDAGCNDELEEAEAWARAGPYPAAPQTLRGAEGRGGFDAQYRVDPASGDGVLRIAQGVAVAFKDTLVIAGGLVAPHPDLPASPALTARAALLNLLPGAGLRLAAIAPYQWSAAEKAPWLARLEPLIESRWGGQFDFFLNRPRWTWLGAAVAVDIDVGERAQGAADHLSLETFKTPAGESLNTFGLDHAVNHGSFTDSRDQTMTLASTSIDPNSFELLRHSVFFAFDDDALDGAATGELDSFIATFNGAIVDPASPAGRVLMALLGTTAHPAHQEIRVDVIGHASAAGSDAYNLDLARRRVESVVGYLRAGGFVNVDSRVLPAVRGEAEADQGDPRRASDQRVDLVVDGGERQIVAVHEFGHALGLGDEYGNVGDAAGHDAMARAMTDAAGNPLPGAVKEHNGGIMSFGNEVRARHYASFHNALQTVTAQSPWSLGPHRNKADVRMECGWPSPPGDWNVPRRDDDGGTRTA